MTKTRIWRCSVCGIQIPRRNKCCSAHHRDGPLPVPLEVRFWARVDKSGECWEWQGGKDRKGYGKIGRGSLKDGTRGLATCSRVAWELTNGSIPDGMFVCHRCDNPSCCRPDHLFLGTCKDNLIDMSLKGRATRRNRKLTFEQVRQIRDLIPDLSQQKIGARFGVTQATIGRIARGVSWKHPH